VTYCKYNTYRGHYVLEGKMCRDHNTARTFVRCLICQDSL
jgi:hypothetical protein